jgi:hypothetical protein
VPGLPQHHVVAGLFFLPGAPYCNESTKHALNEFFLETP